MRPLLSIGLGIELGIGLALSGIALLGPLRAQLVPFVLLFLAAFCCYLVAVWRTVVTVVADSPGTRARLWSIIVFALAFRGVMLVTPPTLSDDLFRYVWEGRVLLAGQSPYAHAPDDPVLVELRDEAIWPQINNKDIASPYPPIAQLGAVVAAALTPHGTLGMKLVSLAGDLGVIAALLLLLHRLGQPLERVLIYAWHPLTAFEFANSGHNDSLMVAPLVLALALASGRPSAQRAHRWGAAVLVGCAALAKITPLLLLPLLPRRLGMRPVVAACLLIAVAWVPLLALGGGGVGGTGSIAVYLGSWQDNDSLHAILRELFGLSAAKSITLLGLAGGVLAVAFHPALRDRPLWWQTYVVLGLSIVLASTVHAWYLAWLLPLLAVHVTHRVSFPFVAPWSGAAWLALSGLVVVPYLTYDTHEWRLWISFAQYVPFYALLAAPLLASAARRIMRSPRLRSRAAPSHRPAEAG